MSRSKHAPKTVLETIYPMISIGWCPEEDRVKIPRLIEASPVGFLACFQCRWVRVPKKLSLCLLNQLTHNKNPEALGAEARIPARISSQ